MVAATIYAFTEPSESEDEAANRMGADEPLIHIHRVGQRARAYH